MKNIAAKVWYTCLLLICISVASFGQTTEELNKKALQALKQKKYKEALEACNKAILKTPNSAQIHFTKAKVYQAMRQPMNALQSIELTIELSAEPTAKMYYVQGILYENFRSYKLAVKAYTQAIKTNKKFTKAYFRRAQAYRKSNIHNGYTLAKKDYKKVLQLAPSHIGACLCLANYYRHDIARYDKTLRIYARGIKQAKNPAKILNARGELYLKNTHHERALKDFLEAARLDTTNANIYQNLANHYYKLGNLDKNVYYCKKAIKVTKSNSYKARLYNDLGATYDQQGKYDLAKEAFLMAIRANNGYKKAYENLEIVLEAKNEPDAALVLFNKGQIADTDSKALRLYDKAILTRPQFLMAHVEKADILNTYHQYSHAIKSYSRALLLAPKYSWLWRSRGKVFHKIDKYKSALYNYDKALKLNPHSAYIYHLKSFAYQQLGDIKQATAMVDSAIKYRPYYHFYYTRKGILLSFQKKEKQAKAYFDFVLHLDPRYKLARYFRGVLYFHHHKLDEARIDLHQVYKLKGDFNMNGKRYNTLTAEAYNYLAKSYTLKDQDRLYVKELKTNAYKRINALLKHSDDQIKAAMQSKSEASLYELRKIKARYLVVKAEMEAIWNHTGKAVGLLDQAYKLGFKTYNPVFSSGFDNVRHSLEFQKLLKKHQLQLTNVPQTKNANYYFAQAMQAKQSKKIGEALDYLNTAIKMNTQSEYFFERGLLRIQQQRISNALQDLNQAIKLDQRSYASYLARAKAMLFYYNEKSKAKSDLNKILSFKNYRHAVEPAILCQTYALMSKVTTSKKTSANAKKQSLAILEKITTNALNTEKGEITILKASVFSMLSEHQRAIGALKIGLTSRVIVVSQLNNINFTPLYKEQTFKQLLTKYNRGLK